MFPCPTLGKQSKSRLHSKWRPQNYRWQNGKQYNMKMNSAQSALARAPGLYWPAPLSPHATPTEGGCKIFIFVTSRYFSKISRNYENKNFSATLLLHNLPSATHPPLTSARRFFNAAQQCYFEMMTNKELYFSILSSIILWWRPSLLLFTESQLFTFQSSMFPFSYGALYCLNLFSFFMTKWQ